MEAAASPAPPVPVRGPWGPHPVSLGLHFHMYEMEQSRAFCESRVRGRVDGLAERGPGREGVRRLGPLSPASSAYLGLGDLSCLRTRRQRKATQRAPPGRGGAPMSWSLQRRAFAVGCKSFSVGGVIRGRPVALRQSRPPPPHMPVLPRLMAPSLGGWAVGRAWRDAGRSPQLHTPRSPHLGDRLGRTRRPPPASAPRAS